jgi:putative acetyltransferase
LQSVEHIELYCLPELQAYYQAAGFTNELGGVQLMRLERDDSKAAGQRLVLGNEGAQTDLETILIRPIIRSDNLQVGALIRRVMAEFECVGEGYSCEDPEVDAMFESYSEKQSTLFVVELNGEVLGCGGVAPLTGGQAGVCELRKMYFDRRLRGKGIGRKLLQLCLDTAMDLGFQTCYLETVERMSAANSLYSSFGFVRLESSLGSTGHSGCDIWYSLDL